VILCGKDHVREGVPAVAIDADADRHAVGLVAMKDGLPLIGLSGSSANDACLDV
jgi:hypothetical protein